MKNAHHIILGIISGLNTLKVLGYLVFIVLLIRNRPDSGTPGWLLGIAFVFLMFFAIALIPYVIILMISLILYFRGIIKKKMGLLKKSAGYSIIGSGMAAISLGLFLGKMFANSSDIKYLYIVIAYFVAEAALALFVYRKLKSDG